MRLKSHESKLPTPIFMKDSSESSAKKPNSKTDSSFKCDNSASVSVEKSFDLVMRKVKTTDSVA